MFFILSRRKGLLKGVKGTYDIDQRIQWTRPFLHKLSGIMLLPLGLLVVAKVPVERLLAPWAVNRV